MNKNFGKAMNKKDVNNEMKSLLFYRPLADTLTLGLYSWIAGYSGSYNNEATMLSNKTPQTLRD